MAKKPIGPRIDESVLKFLGDLFPNPNAGVTFVVESFPTLYTATLRRLRGRFEPGELSLMIDVFNGTFLTSGLAGEHLRQSVADAIWLDKLDEKWGIDGDALNAKIADLTPFEASCLEIWSNMFWYGDPDRKLDLEKYIEVLS